MDLRYADNDGVALAYQVSGTGPPLLFVSNFATNQEALDVAPVFRHVNGLLNDMFQVIAYDQRGVGLSDPGPTEGDPVGTWIRDALAVLDAAGAEQAVLLGADFSGPVAIELAARHPERTTALVLWGTYARLMADDGYETGLPEPLRTRAVDMIVEGWGDPTSAFAEAGVPGAARDADREWVARIQRMAVRKGELRSMVETMFDIDVRPALPLIDVPTLVLHARDERLVPVAHARFLAESIADARLVELPSDQHYIFHADPERAVVEAARLCGARGLLDDQDRTMAVIVFVDIAESTVRAAAEGDRRWRDLLDRHDGRVREYLRLYGGRAVNWAGDGVLATFDSPSRAIRCGMALADTGEEHLPIRVGIHAGEIERRGDDVAGVAVHIANRIESAAGTNDVLVSRTVRDLTAGSEFAFEDRGEHELKGVPDPWRLFAAGRG